MSSWLKSAVHRAMEAGARNPLSTLNIRPSIPLVNRAISFRKGHSTVNNASAAKRLEEAVLTSRGEQRLQMLRKWAALLKGNGRTSEDFVPADDDTIIEPRTVLSSASDSDSEDDVKNFGEVFFNSQALEGLTMSMVNFFYGSDSGST